MLFRSNPQPTSPNPAYPQLTGSIPHDLKMWQPRLGLAWNVGGKDTTVLRVSAGMFDARTPAYLMQRIFTDNGLNTLVLDSNTDASVLNYITVPNKIEALPAGVKTPINAIYGFDPTFRNPRSGQVAVAWEQRLDRNAKVTVSFTRNATWNLQRRYDTNLYPSTTLSNGMAIYPVLFNTYLKWFFPSFGDGAQWAVSLAVIHGSSLTQRMPRPSIANTGQASARRPLARSPVRQPVSTG